MIILDIETSGLTDHNGIWQIGSLEFENPNNYFLEEGRIDDIDEIDKMALRVTGKTEAELRDTSKQSQEQLIMNYLNWVKLQKEKVIWGSSISWDIQRIQSKCIRYGEQMHKFFLDFHGRRGFDIEQLAQDIYKKIHGEYLFGKNLTHEMSLKKTLELCGVPGERILTYGPKIIKEGKVHKALEDCKLEAECLSRLEFGKNKFREYSKYKIPKYLLK